MQRLKQHNLGAQLRLLDEDFLIAQGPVFPFRGALRRERFHIELGGYGEHDYHQIAAESAIFGHYSIRLGAKALSDLKTALQAAQLQCRSEVEA